MSDPINRTNLFDRFGRDSLGAVAPTFGIAFALLVVPMAGATVDISRSISSRNDLQDATDGAALALSRLPANTSNATLTTTATNWIKAQDADPNVAVTVVATYAGNGNSTNTIDVTATSTITSTIGAAVGIKTIPITGHSTTTWGLSHIELALVLDNTGSMADDNKLTSLQSAAKQLVSTLSSSASSSGDPNSLKIGVVPFSISVNIGSGNHLKPWMSGIMPSSYGADIFTKPNTDRFLALKAMNVTWGGCVEDRPMPYDILDTPPGTTAAGASYPAPNFVPFFAPDEPDGTFTYNGQTYQSYDNNYLTDVSGYSDWQHKQGDPGKYNKAPRTGTGTWTGYSIGPNAGCGTAALLPLTTDMNAVNNELNQMVANGNTHIPIGLVWGWHVLSPYAPFALGSAYGTPNTTKIIVLVTDGANTYNTGYNDNICQSGSNVYYCSPTAGDNSGYTGLGYAWQNRISTNSGDFTNPQSALDDRLTSLCNNVKSQGIVVYTVPVEVTDTNIKTLLQNCASNANNYIDATSSSQLSAAFSNIAGSIAKLRLSK